MASYHLKCAQCGKSQREDDYFISCPFCGGFLEVTLDEIPSEPVDSHYPSIFKYHRLMPFDPASGSISSQETIEETPVFLAEKLSQRLGIELYFKDETVMPSGTWKDREGFVSIHRLVKNAIPDLVVFSSGNTGTSLARSASIIKGPRIHLVIPKASEKRLKTYPQFFHPDYVKVTFFDGSNDECIVQARKLASTNGYKIEGGFANYARREGLKLLGLETILGWDKKPDWYVQPVAGGIGIYSFHKAYRDLGMEDQCPRMLGVQAEICAPMVNAWKAGAATLEERFIPQEVVPSRYVRVLRTRRPVDSYPILKKLMDKVNGRFESACDHEIHDALRLFYLDDYYKAAYKETGRLVGLEPATSLAGVVKGVREGYIARGEKVLFNVSGAAKTGDVDTEWIADLL
ncbi:MAG: pyridoxal-phosphate dependent enzyme [SAR202 cluster bacterium]|nr:pyridoxal-phosphate dependent enzyme [SAR202 cluster bacterium]